MKKRECIDILLASYNGEKYIKEQIDSILQQTYENIRLIISDDASVDNTKNILEEYEKKDKRVKVYFQEKNIGLVKNFEFLLSKVESKYYMLSDQDDVWFKDKVENTFAKLIISGAGLVCTDLMLVDKDLNSLNETFNKKMGKLNKLCCLDDWKMVYLYNVVTGCTIMSEKKYIKDILPIPTNKNILHDHFIPLIVGSKAKIVYLDEPTMMYRQHEDNQVGTRKYTSRFNSFNETREYLIALKISIFETYMENSYRFNDEFNKLTKEALLYYRYVKDVKVFTLKYRKIFKELYKYETRYYRFWNGAFLNCPIIARIWYNLFKKK